MVNLHLKNDFLDEERFVYRRSWLVEFAYMVMFNIFFQYTRWKERTQNSISMFSLNILTGVV